MFESDRELLRHIDSELDFLLEESTRITADAFLESRLLQHAFARSLEIIGEAVKQLSTECILENPGIEWRKMAGMRDKLIHGYFSIDYRIVWDVVSEKVPMLRRAVQSLLLRE